MTKYIWGFDLSLSNTGLAILNEDGKPVLITSIQTNKDKNTGERLNQLYQSLAPIASMFPADKIIIERGFSRFNIATQMIYRVHGVINLMFHMKEQIYYPPKTVKEALLGGNATKKQLKDLILEKFPKVEFYNEDESDAFAVALTYFIKNNIIEWNKPEKKARKKVKKDVKIKKGNESV
jgi:Holliday junction resolvasome RuvABC endonuclease subunit